MWAHPSSGCRQEHIQHPPLSRRQCSSVETQKMIKPMAPGTCKDFESSKHVFQSSLAVPQGTCFIYYTVRTCWLSYCVEVPAIHLGDPVPFGWSSPKYLFHVIPRLRLWSLLQKNSHSKSAVDHFLDRPDNPQYFKQHRRTTSPLSRWSRRSHPFKFRRSPHLGPLVLSPFNETHLIATSIFFLSETGC